jgi:hypothetical protein
MFPLGPLRFEIKVDLIKERRESIASRRAVLVLDENSDLLHSLEKIVEYLGIFR